MTGRDGAFHAALAAIALLGALAGALHPEPFPTDGDEAFQAACIHASPDRFRAALLADAVHPPLDYVVDRLIERAAPGAAARRIAPTLWGFLGVLVFGALLAARAGRFAGIAGALLFAFALYRVSETRRLRPYPLAILLMLAALFLLDRYLARPSGTRLAAAFVLAVAAAWTLYFAGAVLLLAMVALVLEDLGSEDAVRRRSGAGLLRFSPLIAAAGLLAAAPLLPLLRAAAATHVRIAAPPEDPRRIARVFSYATVSPNAGYAFPPRMLFLAALLVGCGLIAAGTVAALRRPGCRFLVAWGYGGIALIELVKRLHPHFDSFRYYVPAAVALTALEAIAIDRLRRRAGTAIAAGLLGVALLLLVPPLTRYYRYGIWYFSSGAGKPGIFRAAPPARPGAGTMP
ncbi:MAG TPA: hypothetical protein VFL12_11570 [Thermoanaerobaculia bacterium]|nr:hypothetical protein [Thermoanaerobaculia bacterium]